MNVSLASLWLPILLSGIAVFFVSSLIWAVIQYHNSDWQKPSDEDAVSNALRGLPPGHYAVPHAADNAAKADEAWQARYKEGPVAMITIMPPAEVAMGKQMGQWFVVSIVLSVFVAYIAGTTLVPGTDYMKVFQVTATTAFLAHGGAAGMDYVWFGYTAGRTMKNILDALLYGLVTAGIFGWLWPTA